MRRLLQQVKRPSSAFKWTYSTGEGYSQKYNLKLVGINQHMGSLFLTGIYVEGVVLLTIAKRVSELEFVDIGGVLWRTIQAR